MGKTGFYWLRIMSSGGRFKHGNEPSGSVKKACQCLTSWVVISFSKRGPRHSSSVTPIKTLGLTAWSRIILQTLTVILKVEILISSYISRSFIPFHKKLPLFSIPRQLNPFHTLTPHSCTIHFNSTFPSVLKLSMYFWYPNACLMSRPSHLLDILLTIYDEKYKLRSFSLRTLPQFSHKLRQYLKIGHNTRSRLRIRGCLNVLHNHALRNVVK
jgi:hypothetical protein